MGTHKDGSLHIDGARLLPCPHPECWHGGSVLSVLGPIPDGNGRMYSGVTGEDPTKAMVKATRFQRTPPNEAMPFWNWVGVEE